MFSVLPSTHADFSVLKRFFRPNLDSYSMAESLSNIINDFDTGLEDLAWGFVKGQYVSALPYSPYDNSCMRRLPFIEALLRLGHPVSDFSEELEIELKAYNPDAEIEASRLSRLYGCNQAEAFKILKTFNPYARIEAARLSLIYGCHEVEALEVLNTFASSRKNIDVRARAKIALFKAKKIKCLLSEYITELKRRCAWSPLHKSYLLSAATPRAINKLRISDFRLLVLDQVVDAGTCTSKLLRRLLEKRKFTNVKQKLEILIALRKKGHLASYLAQYIGRKEKASLRKRRKPSRIEKELLLACEKVKKPAKLKNYSEVSIHELASNIRSRRYLKAENILFVVIKKISSSSLDCDYVAGELRETFEDLSRLVYECGPRIIPQVIDAIVSDDYLSADWVTSFLFKCLSHFEYSKMEKHLPRLFDMLEGRCSHCSLRESSERPCLLCSLDKDHYMFKSGCLQCLLSGLLADLGTEVQPLILERLRDSEKGSEYLLSALSNVL